MHKQHERDAHQPQTTQPGRRAAVERGDGEINLSVLQPRLQLGCEAGLEAQPDARMLPAQQLHDGRQVLAQHQFGRADPDLGC